MLLKTNGCMLSGRWTKHINTRYFMIVNKVASGEVEVDHCPAKRMQADALNKPKQGTPWQVFRGGLINIPKLYKQERASQVWPIPAGQCKRDTGWQPALAQELKNKLEWKQDPRLTTITWVSYIDHNLARKWPSSWHTSDQWSNERANKTAKYVLKRVR